LVYDGTKQAVLHRIEEARRWLPSAGQEIGVHGVKGADLDAHCTAAGSQTATEGADLGLVRQNDPDG
jgi:hypothetical protein